MRVIALSLPCICAVLLMRCLMIKLDPVTCIGLMDTTSFLASDQTSSAICLLPLLP